MDASTVLVGYKKAILHPHSSHLEPPEKKSLFKMPSFLVSLQVELRCLKETTVIIAAGVYCVTESTVLTAGRQTMRSAVMCSDGTIWPWGKTMDTIRYCTKYRDTIRYTVPKRSAVCNGQQSKINAAFSLTPSHAFRMHANAINGR